MVKRSKAASTATPRSPDNPAISGLSGIVAHELNNIAVPLQLFTDIAAANVPANDQLAQCFDELRIGISRLTSLAVELESLVAGDSRIGVVSIGECVAGAERQLINPPPETHWACAPTTLIAADTLFALRAITSLLRTASSGVKLNLSRRQTVGLRCAACGAPAAPGEEAVCVEGWGSRGISAEAVRNPLQPGVTVRSTRRLSLAATVEYGHRAGAHVLLDEDIGSLSIVFPLA
jgi:hypothetical protein